MTVQDLPVDVAAARLRRALGERVLLAGDPGYDDARTPWNVAIEQRPFAVVRPESAADVVDAVRAAVDAGLRVLPQSTGHGAGAFAGVELGDVVLVQLGALRGVSVDPVARVARVLGGSQWNDVLEAAAPHGLTALHGSSGDVGVAGYCLAGGLSFYARRHGLAVDAVRAVQLVTADGELVRADADEHPELFWAVRGGAEAFGIVVSLEIGLLPVPDVVAGMLLWDAARAAEIAHAWADWSASAPESATTTLRVLHFPPMPELPPFLSGRSVVVVDGAILESDAAAAELLAPLRALGPEVDTFGRIPAAALVGVHLDPPAPTPALTAHAVLSGLPHEAVDAFVAAAGAPGLFIAELRHLGGAIGRPVPGGGAVSALAGEYLVHGIAVAPVPEALAPAGAAVRAAVAALAPWHADAVALTFVDDPATDRSPAYGESASRLRDAREAADPRRVFVSRL